MSKFFDAKNKTTTVGTVGDKSLYDKVGKNGKVIEWGTIENESQAAMDNVLNDWYAGDRAIDDQFEVRKQFYPNVSEWQKSKDAAKESWRARNESIAMNISNVANSAKKNKTAVASTNTLGSFSIPLREADPAADSRYTKAVEEYDKNRSEINNYNDKVGQSNAGIDRITNPYLGNSSFDSSRLNPAFATTGSGLTAFGYRNSAPKQQLMDLPTAPIKSNAYKTTNATIEGEGGWGIDLKNRTPRVQNTGTKPLQTSVGIDVYQDKTVVPSYDAGNSNLGQISLLGGKIARYAGLGSDDERNKAASALGYGYGGKKSTDMKSSYEIIEQANDASLQKQVGDMSLARDIKKITYDFLKVYGFIDDNGVKPGITDLDIQNAIMYDKSNPAKKKLYSDMQTVLSKSKNKDIRGYNYEKTNPEWTESTIALGLIGALNSKLKR